MSSLPQVVRGSMILGITLCLLHMFAAGTDCLRRCVQEQRPEQRDLGPQLCLVHMCPVKAECLQCTAGP